MVISNVYNLLWNKISLEQVFKGNKMDFAGRQNSVNYLDPYSLFLILQSGMDY